MKIDRELAIAARARIRRRVSCDAAAAQSDSVGAKSSPEQLALRDVRGRFVGVARADRHVTQAISCSNSIDDVIATLMFWDRDQVSTCFGDLVAPHRKSLAQSGKT